MYEVVITTRDHGTFVEDARTREDAESIWLDWVEEEGFAMLRIVDRASGLMAGNASTLSLKWRDGAIVPRENVFDA